MRTRRWKEVFEGSQPAACGCLVTAGGTPWHALLFPGTPQSPVGSATAATLVYMIGHNGAGEQEASCFVDGKPVARSVMEVGSTLGWNLCMCGPAKLSCANSFGTRWGFCPMLYFLT